MLSSESERRFLLQIEGRLRFSAAPDPANPLVLALHGYGQSPEILLPLVRRMFGPAAAIAALAAPFPFYDRLGPEGQTVYHWGTRHHWDQTIRLHHAMVREALAQFPEFAGRTVLLGFSQPVGLNYRFAGTHTGAVQGVIGLCGGVPSRWEEEAYAPFSTPLLHIARSEDEFYPVAQVERFPERLRHHARDVEFHLLPGQHRFPSQAGPLVEAWLRRIGLR